MIELDQCQLHLVKINQSTGIAKTQVWQCIAGHVAVPGPVRRREASRLHVYGMCELRRSERFAAADNLAKTRIDGDFPAYGNRRVRHAAAIERIRREPRP